MLCMVCVCTRKWTRRKMYAMKLKSLITGECVVVRATTNHPQSSYNKAVWVDVDNQAICQEGLEFIAGFELIDEKVEFGNRLRSKREEKGLNKNYFIKRGLRLEALDAIENGRKNYTIDSLLLYLGILDVEINF